MRAELWRLHQSGNQREDKILRGLAPNGAIRGRTAQSLAHAPKQGRCGEQGLPRPKGVAEEDRRQPAAFGRSAKQDPGALRGRDRLNEIGLPKGGASPRKPRKSKSDGSRGRSPHLFLITASSHLKCSQGAS